MSKERKAGFVYEPLSGEYQPVEPCPFCGGNDITTHSDPGQTALMLTCMNCGARGPNWDYREERAICSWNRGRVQ